MIYFTRRRNQNQRTTSPGYFKTLKESCGFYWCTGKKSVLLWLLIDLLKKNWEPRLYTKTDYFDLLRTVTTNPNNQLHDNRWGYVPVSNNHPTPI
jgi:hypothetical protein